MGAVAVLLFLVVAGGLVYASVRRILADGDDDPHTWG